MTKSPVNFIVVQAGVCVYGTGDTANAAIADARRNMAIDRRDGLSSYPDDAESLLDSLTPRGRHVDGDIVMLEVGDAGFDSYLTNQGGFERRVDGVWTETVYGRPIGSAVQDD